MLSSIYLKKTISFKLFDRRVFLPSDAAQKIDIGAKIHVERVMPGILQ